MPPYKVQLFVAGETPRSHLAVSNLRELFERAGRQDHELEVIDVLERPDLAERERILATPFVLKVSPLPIRRVVGDLSDFDLAARALDLNPREVQS